MFQTKWKNPVLQNLRTYRSWESLRRRCLNANDPEYPNYGARGIFVCERWLNDFDAFVEDMGPRPEGTSIERIDVNGNYDKQNCVWATPKQQGRNRRNNVFIEIEGERKTAAEWAEISGVPKNTLHWRLKKGVRGKEILRITEKPKPKEHGTFRMYVHGRCRCVECTRANRDYHRNRRNSLGYDL